MDRLQKMADGTLSTPGDREENREDRYARNDDSEVKWDTAIKMPELFKLIHSLKEAGYEASFEEDPDHGKKYGSRSCRIYFISYLNRDTSKEIHKIYIKLKSTYY